MKNEASRIEAFLAIGLCCDNRPLSPKGKVASAVRVRSRDHPRSEQGQIFNRPLLSNRYYTLHFNGSPRNSGLLP